MKVGLLGGAFNPPHNGHIALGQIALKELKPDKLLFIPSGKPPHKQIDGELNGPERALLIKTAVCSISVETLKKRIEALGLFSDNKQKQNFLDVYASDFSKIHNDKIAVSSIEIQSELVCHRATYTIDTVRAIKSQEPDWELLLIIGADQAAKFDTWKESEQLRKMARVCVAARQNENLSEIKKMYSEFVFFDFPLINISSTDVRRRIKESISVSEMIPGRVEILYKAVYNNKNNEK